MAETVTMQMDKELAGAVHTIKVLRDCGIIRIEDEASCVHDVWDRLDDMDKRFIAGMIKGSTSMLANNKRD